MVDIQPYSTLRDGITFHFRGVDPDTGDLLDIDLEVPTLNLDSLKKLHPKLRKIGEAPGVEDMETLCDALVQALSRNYRNVPAWLINQTVDVANMADMLAAVMDQSGLKRKEIEEKKAIAQSANGLATTGMISTPG